MTQKFKDLFILIKTLSLDNQEIAILVVILFLILLIKRTKFTVKFLLLLFLGLSVWFWFFSSFEGRKDNKKFKRYKEDRIQDTVEEDGKRTAVPKNENSRPAPSLE
jgi:hypothetical protein